MTDIPMHPEVPRSEAAAPAPLDPAGGPPAGPTDAASPAERRRRRRWPWVVLVALLMLALGAGATYRLTLPARDRLRDQRDALQSQLDQANDELATQKHIASSAQAASDACQRLSTDAKSLSDDMDSLKQLLQDPANDNVVPGSPEEKALYDKLDTLSGSITFEQGAVTSDAASCKSAATGI